MLTLILTWRSSWEWRGLNHLRQTVYHFKLQR